MVTAVVAIALAPACSQGSGDGRIAGALNVPNCWTGPFELDADFLAVHSSLATRSLIRRSHARGKQVYVWTLNDPVRMFAMISRGVDGVITDRPAMAREVLARREKLSSAERLVVGLPLNMDDTMGATALATVRWGEDLGRRTGKEVLFVDERLSSFEAEQILKQRKRSGDKLTRKAKKERLDALAAAEFLQAFLDGKLVPLSAG